ncbi:centrosomal protein CEP76, putative [Plasmodium malariae]|uniref:Centrosomal protein CEP76, putative n=1 Tax=Plasmodium malariae TaxID=5858 RepID=A0A1D3SN75_PLAMA|nr:centrosomal protein CEP76, putative [Plasmodium malariae]SCO93337.1 centrosomal protein CEP76, putative [Plasmodium malariae]
MYLINKIKEIFYENEESNNLREEKEKKKKVHISELKDEIWLYKNEYNKERLSEEYASDYKSEEDNYYDNDENEKKKKDHFLEVPLFDEDECGRNIKKNLRHIRSKKIKAIKRNEESEISEESLSTTDDDEDVDEPFLDLYEELKREHSIKEIYNPMLKPRLWRFEFFIKYIHNLENQMQKNFYLVSFSNNKKINLYGDLKKELLYTPGYSIEPGEVKYLRIPLTIWDEKELRISYNDLQNFEISVEMWCIKEFVFNDLYASSKRTLKEIIENDPDTNIILKRKIEKKNIIFEAQRLGVYMQLSEIFEFHMALDSWWFIANSQMPSYLKTLPKFLRFKFPLSEDDWVIHSSYKSYNNFWLYPGYFCFIGTYQQLANAFFIITVLCYNSNYRYKPPILLGSCIISLKSVTEYPFFKGIIKKLTLDKTKFKQGEIVGNIKCFVNSYGIDEGDSNIQRPVQPLSDATLVNQLILNDHYLVIRIIKCENLPISSIDLNNVNINVWVKWDGIVNKTNTVSKTTSPFFYQNLYYPIRLVDKKELTNENLIRNILPVDLISKGEICFEVHNNNEIYSTILGIFELPFSDIFNYGTYDYRSLAQESAKSSSMYNDYKDNYEAISGGMNVSSDNYDDYYVRQYKTIVYKNTLELMYSKVHLKSLNKENIQTKRESTISVEAFVIPPLPSDLIFLKENRVQNSSAVYKSMSKRWEKDFGKFNDTYLQWFPKAIKDRSFPCVSRNDFDNNLYPLCSFITSINLPSQVSTPGPLFHWLNNIEYIENEDESSIFTPPYFFLSYKKGTIQDHVILLCCCLKGLEYDAYVCKGTINNGKNEHYWVMTRHEEGWVCFWEVTNKSIIHLKNRWNNNNFLKNSEISLQNEMINKINNNDNEKYYSGEYLMSFVKYGMEELKNREREIKEEYNLKEENKLYTMDIYGDNQMKDEKVNIEEILHNDEEFYNMFEVKYEKNETYNNNKALKYLLENFSRYIPISPKMFLLDYENTLAYVPYSSIEVIFNDEQLYGNMQNHHPACILYDLENNYHWRPFLNQSPTQIKNEITISTPLSDKLSVKYTNELEEEIQEMIHFMRNNEGLETDFEYSKEIRYFLEMYIDLCEYKLNLDNNYNTKPENYEWSEQKGKGDNIQKGDNRQGSQKGDENLDEDENEQNVYETGKKGEKNDNAELKRTWSQYKNDYYPNIEAQYINKEELNFYNSYHPTRNIEMMNNERKRHLINIPDDYIYGMNDEIYSNGKEQYIRNYVFSKDSTDILNNFDESVRKKNIKRFNNTAVHYLENVEDIDKSLGNIFIDMKSEMYINQLYNADSKVKNEYRTDDRNTFIDESKMKGEAIKYIKRNEENIQSISSSYTRGTYNVKDINISSSKQKTYAKDNNEEEKYDENEEELFKEVKEKYDENEEELFKEEVKEKYDENEEKLFKEVKEKYDENEEKLFKEVKEKYDENEEELYKEIKEKYYYDEDFCSLEKEGHSTNKVLPNKFIKRYNKQNNNLFILQMSLRKKEKRIKQEMVDVKLKKINKPKDKMSKKTFCSFIDTQEFLKCSLSSKEIRMSRENMNNKESTKSIEQLSSECLNDSKRAPPIYEECVNNRHTFNGYFIIPSKGNYTNEKMNNSVNKEFLNDNKNHTNYSFEGTKSKEESPNGGATTGTGEIRKKKEKTEKIELSGTNINSSRDTLLTSTLYTCSLSKNDNTYHQCCKENKKGYFEIKEKLISLVDKYKRRHNIKAMEKKSSCRRGMYGDEYDMTRMKKNIFKCKIILFKCKFKKKEEEKKKERDTGEKENFIDFTKNSFSLSNRTLIEKENSTSLSDREIVSLNKRKNFLHQNNHQMYRDSNFLDMNNGQAGVNQNNYRDELQQQTPGYPVAQSNNIVNDPSNIMQNSEFSGKFNECVQNKSMNKECGQNENDESASKKKYTLTSPPKTWSRLNSTSKYVAHQISQWRWYYSLEEQYFNWQYYKFPVPPNHTFVGFPIHFSTIDFTEVKSFLLHSKRFENIIKLSIDNISFVIYCKVYPLISGVMSNWVFLGCLVPWMTAQERETKMKKTPKKNVNRR